MSIDPNQSATAAVETDVPAIENELPTYRAISPGSVFALTLGVASVLSYSHWAFAGLAVLAVVVGLLADRKIQRLSDVYTGRGLAQAGIALGLVFGLTSVTIGTVQDYVRNRQAGGFARTYEKVLNKGTIDDAVWYGQPPSYRKNYTPAKMIAEILSKAPDKRMFEMQIQMLKDLKEKLAEPGAEAHYTRVEYANDDGRALSAGALFELHRPQAKTADQKEQFALAKLKSVRENGKLEWWVEEVIFPYKPASYVVPDKPVDDGHGHGQNDGHGH